MQQTKQINSRNTMLSIRIIQFNRLSQNSGKSLSIASIQRLYKVLLSWNNTITSLFWCFSGVFGFNCIKEVITLYKQYNTFKHVLSLYNLSYDI